MAVSVARYAEKSAYIYVATEVCPASAPGQSWHIESLLPPMMVQQIDPREVVYLAAREAGFAPDEINIEGLAEAVAFEPLWVMTPVRGLTCCGR